VERSPTQQSCLDSVAAKEPRQLVLMPQSNQQQNDLSTAKRIYYLSVIRAVAVVNKVKRAIWKVVVSKEGN